MLVAGWRRAGGRAAAFAVLVLLAGCGDDAGGAVAFERPGWMAEQQQRQEEYQTGLQSCVAGKGWNVTVTTGGAVVEPFDDADYPRWEADRDACRAEMGLGDASAPPTRERVELLYARQVDTWRCVGAVGHDVPAPPSEEAYVEELTASAQSGDGGVTEWGPYGDLVERLSSAEWDDLVEECPEPWWAD